MNILVCQEKHATVYWRADNPQEWAHSSLAILTRRWNDGYWYYEPEMPERPDHKPEDIKTIQDTEYRQILEQRWKWYQAALAEWNSANDWYSRAKAVVEKQDTSCVTIGSGKWSRQEPKAWVLLNERSDYEYEYVEIETLRSARPEPANVH